MEGGVHFYHVPHVSAFGSQCHSLTPSTQCSPQTADGSCLPLFHTTFGRYDGTELQQMLLLSSTATRHWVMPQVSNNNPYTE